MITLILLLLVGALAGCQASAPGNKVAENETSSSGVPVREESDQMPETETEITQMPEQDRPAVDDGDVEIATVRLTQATEESMPAETEVSQLQPAPTGSQATETQATETQADRAQPPETQPSELQPTADVQPVETKSSEPQPTAEVQPVETQPSEPQPTAEVQPAETQSPEPQPTADVQPAETEAIAVPPVETEQAEAAPVIIRQGQFKDADRVHKGSGTATFYQRPDGTQFLSFENFAVCCGPDLYVFLAANPAPTSKADLGDYLELSSLKASSGNQAYEIPAGTDLSQFNSIVIYCKPFQVIISTATLG